MLVKGATVVPLPSAYVRPIQLLLALLISILLVKGGAYIHNEGKCANYEDLAFDKDLFH